MSKISVLIIGAGNISTKHLESLTSLKKIKLYGIVSRTYDKSLVLAKKFKIEKTFKSIEETYLYSNYFDLIFILVSPDQTLRVFNKIKLLNKIIFFEKPVGINLKENLTILNEIKKLKLKTFIGYNRRYYSIFHKAIAKLISNNKKITSLIIEGHERLWQIKKIYNNKRITYYWPYLNSIHNVDLIRFISGEINYKKFHRVLNLNSYMATMKSKNDISISYCSNYDYYDGWSVKIYNNQGDLALFRPLENCFFIKHNSKYEIKPEKLDLKFKTGFRKMHMNLIKFTLTGKKQWPDQDVFDAYQSALLVKKIFFK